MRLILMATLMVSLVPAAAYAQEDAADPPATEQPAQGGDDQEARMRFDLGERYYDQGRFPEAAVEFQAAYDASGRDALLYNVYIAHRDAGNAAEAAQALRAYLATDHPEAARRTNLEARLEALDRQAASDTPVAEPDGEGGSGQTLVMVGVIVAGVGAAALLSSLGPGFVALDGEAQLTERCPDGRCSAADASLIDSTRTMGIVTDVLWVSGAVLAAAGVTLLTLGLLSDDEAEAQAVMPNGGCGPEGCFVSMEGSF